MIKKSLWHLFMDGVQLPQGYSHFKEVIDFLPFSSQTFLVFILLTFEGWKAESTLEPPSAFEHRTPGLGIQHLNHWAKEEFRSTWALRRKRSSKTVLSFLVNYCPFVRHFCSSKSLKKIEKIQEGVLRILYN